MPKLRHRPKDVALLTKAEYNEFAGELDLLAEPLRAALPGIAFVPYHVPGQGRPGIFASAERGSAAKYSYPLSILIRWSSSAIGKYVAEDDEKRAELRNTFSDHVPQVLDFIEKTHRVDWQGRSQGPRRGIAVNLDDF